MEKANQKQKKPAFQKEIGPISNSFSLSNTRSADFFVKNCFMEDKSVDYWGENDTLSPTSWRFLEDIASFPNIFLPYLQMHFLTDFKQQVLGSQYLLGDAWLNSATGNSDRHLSNTIS